MSNDAVKVERIGNVALVTLNRPQARNAINADLARGLVDAVEGSQDAGCIVLTGADPAFCAGVDLKNLGVTNLRDIPPYSQALLDSDTPLIAAVNGPAVTGGFEVALRCDFIIASEKAAFADTHLRVGVYPGSVMVDLPPRVGLAWARQISMSGNFVDAATALRIGIANHVVPHDELLPFTMKIAEAIAEQDKHMVKNMRHEWSAAQKAANTAHNAFAEQGGFRNKGAADVAASRDAVLARAKDQLK